MAAGPARSDPLPNLDFDLGLEGDAAPGFTALLDEYMQEVAQANSLEPFPQASPDRHLESLLAEDFSVATQPQGKLTWPNSNTVRTEPAAAANAGSHGSNEGHQDVFRCDRHVLLLRR